MTVPDGVLRELRELAIRYPDRECCGILTDADELLPVRNVSKDPRNSFVFDPKEYWAALKELAQRGQALRAIYHTHPGGSALPSRADREYIEASRRSALIVSANDWKWIEYGD